MDWFEELDALYSEHFGYTVSRETINAEETEETTGNVDDWDDDEGESRVRSASARVEQLAGAVGNTSVDGEERFGSDYEDHSSQGDEEEEQGLEVRCDCSKVNCSLNFDRDRVEAHILSIREMQKDEKEMYIMGALQTIGGENTRGGKRKRMRFAYSYEGKRVCRRVFRYIFDIGHRTLKSIIKHINENGRVPRTHGNKGKKPKHALVYDDIRYCVDFLNSFAEIYGLPMPAAPRGREEEAPVYLPASMTKQEIHKKYIEACEVTNRRAMKLTAFQDTWRQCLPHIKISSPRDDVCQRCETIRKQIVDAVTEEEKLEGSRILQLHIQDAQRERALYRDSVREAAEEIADFRRPDGPIPPLQNEFTKVHFTFDYSQMVTLPHHYRQMGPLYFVAGRKIQIFGVRDDSAPRQYNYLIDEDNSIGLDGSGIHGPDAVISMLHDTLFRHGYGEKRCVLHADNCSGQNKNQFVIAYLSWRVLTQLHDEIVLLMQIPGHTRCLIDSGFAHIKKLFRRSDVDALSQLVVLVEKSAYSNTAITYQNVDNGEENWTWYDWKTFLKEYFLPVKGIRKFHHFRVTSKDPGFVYVKTSAPEAETRIKILKKEIPESAYPSSLPASGLSRDRAKYIYQTLRPLVRTAYQDATCPRPHEE